MKSNKRFKLPVVSNLSLYMMITLAFGYALQLIPATRFAVNLLTLEPALILRGQVWRIITWVLCPGAESNAFVIVISLYFYYSIGKTLERTWGEYRYNVYIFSGLLFTVVGAFILYFILWFMGYGSLTFVSIMGVNPFSTYYVCMSIFLAFAATFPDMEVLLMFILPIKVKVLGIAYAALMVVGCLQGGIWTTIPMVASLFNFIVFFITQRKRIGITKAQYRERVKFKQNVSKANNTPARHKCAICGRTNETHPDLSFRFCSKCKGNYEYCEDHIFTHKHVE